MQDFEFMFLMTLKALGILLALSNLKLKTKTVSLSIGQCDWSSEVKFGYQFPVIHPIIKIEIPEKNGPLYYD